jgi:hypothetical protein
MPSKQCSCRGEYDECGFDGHRPTPDGKDRCRRVSSVEHPMVDNASLCAECADDYAARVVDKYWDLVWAMDWKEQRDGA